MPIETSIRSINEKLQRSTLVKTGWACSEVNLHEARDLPVKSPQCQCHIQSKTKHGIVASKPWKITGNSTGDAGMGRAPHREQAECPRLDSPRREGYLGRRSVSPFCGVWRALVPCKSHLNIPDKSPLRDIHSMLLERMLRSL